MNKLSDTDFAGRVLESLHINDLISGADSTEEVLRFYTHTKSYLAPASFNLRKFISNSTELNQTVNKITKTQIYQQIY